jgi:hypothetical protein
MKNRRLNVLFMAIIALAAAPQALQDVYGLVNAAHERAETELWSVFLSYQTPDANAREKSAATELVAVRREQETQEACPLERTAEQKVEVVRGSQSNNNAASKRNVNVEARRASAKAITDVPEMVEAEFEDGETEARTFTVRTVAFSEKDQKALKALGLHARDTERIADAASKTALASVLQGRESMQIKMKQTMEVDRLLRQKTRAIRDRGESFDEIPAPPNSLGGM